MAGDADLVVREDLLARLLESGPGVTWDVQGTAGTGKSVLLRELERRVARAGVVVLVEMADYLTPFERGTGTDGGTRGLTGELRRLGQVVSAIVSGLLARSPAARGAADDIVNHIGRAAQDMAKLPEPEARERAGELVERLREEVSRLTASRSAAGGRVYLLVDTFEVALGHPLGEWLLRLLDGLDGAVTAVARRPGPEAVSLRQAVGLADRGKPEVLPVGGLTPGQVSDYLVRRLGALGEEIAAEVYQFTGGHALAVGLSADLIGDMRRRGEQVTVEGLLDSLNGQQDQDQDNNPDALLARQFITSAKGREPEAGAGLDCLWPVRRFEFPLLEFLLPAGSHRLAERLVGYSFVERRTSPDGSAQPYYVVHDRVRDQGLALLGAESGESGRLQALHGLAEEYYREHTDDFLAGYEGWFRYEDAGWQVLVREWLYHVSRLDEPDQVNGRRGLAKLFFDSFWWWGHNVPFRFCEELLADWAEMAKGRAGGDAADAVWGEKLRELYVRYPKGWRAQATREDWTALQELLEFFRDAREIREAEPENQHMRHVRGLLQLFLGIAEWHIDPQSENAGKYLRTARELFLADTDGWDVAWASFQEADAALARDDRAGAVAVAERAWAELGEIDDDDFELAANLHRVHADAAWARGERGLALDLYARAVLSAYKFQVDVGDPDIPPVDEYTQAFMTEMHERTAARLAELHAAGEQQAVRDACARIRRFFGPYWNAVGQPAMTAGPAGLAAEELVAEQRAGEAVSLLFPPPPSPADLHQPDTPYVLTASDVLYDMADNLREPPGTALPPAAG